MTDSAERLVTAFAKGLMLGLLEAHDGSNRPRGRRREPTSAPAEPLPFPRMSEPEDLLAAAHEALRSNGDDPEQLDLQQVAEAMKRAREESEVLAMVQTQPGPGESESHSWTGVG